MGGSTRRGIQNLYIELILTMIVVAFGSIILAASRSAMQPALSNVKFENLNLAAYVINGTDNVIIVNWGDASENVELVCILNDGNVSVSDVKVNANSTVPVQMDCQGKLVVTVGGNPIPTFIVSGEVNSP